MTPKEKAEELIKRFTPFSRLYSEIIDNECLLSNDSKQCALIAVQEIINSNPHSNPFNTDVYPTMEYWLKVKKEIKKYESNN